MSKRDQTIDRLRGLAMFWVILIHVFYWGYFFKNDLIILLQSFFLFEMPLFFFVTGAGNSFSKVDGYFKFVYKRYKQLLIPYWVFAFICAALTIGKFLLTEPPEALTIIKVILSWLLPVNRQISAFSYLTSALWFIPVYLCIVLALPLFIKIKQTRGRFVFFFLLVSLFIGTCVLNLGWVQNVAFYSLWTYIGLFYSDIILAIKQKIFRLYLLIIAFAGAAYLVVLYFMEQPIDMQYNKFPPNITFGVFSFVMMTLIVLMIPYINKLFDLMEKHTITKKIVDLYSTRSMTIFLYQVFAFAVSVRICNMFISGNGMLSSSIKFLLCLILTVPACALLALIFGGVESIGNKTVKNKGKKREC